MKIWTLPVQLFETSSVKFVSTFLLTHLSNVQPLDELSFPVNESNKYVTHIIMYATV